MKAVEFQSAVAPDGGIQIPPEIAREIPAGERLRVVVIWDDPDQAWRAAGRRRFDAAYSPEDSVYVDGAGPGIASRRATSRL